MNTQMIPVVEQYVVEHLRCRLSFTALDISNALKAQQYLVTHGSVAEIVRDIYQSGAMSYYGFDRRLINVMTQSGTKKTRAFLYLHNEAREKDYTTRDQNSLPTVSPDQAKPLPVTFPATSLNGRQSGIRKGGRRDGAFAVPRNALIRLGWQTGDRLALDSQPGQITLQRERSLVVSNTCVWKEQRLRICRRKMVKAQIVSDDVSLTIGVDCLILTRKT